MKVKSDFVTNSSSTSFILKYFCSLEPKTDIHDPHKINLKKIVNKIGKKFSLNGTKPIISNYSNHSNLKSNIIHAEYDKENVAELDFSVLSLIYSDENSKDIFEFMTDLELTSEILNGDPESKYVDKIIEILKEAFKEISGNLEFSFSQFAIEIFGDGWNQGDPMGQYTTIYDLLTNQNKVGKITRIDGKWNLILKDF
jgi:hypothetical protein